MPLWETNVNDGLPTPPYLRELDQNVTFNLYLHRQNEAQNWIN